MLKLVSDEELRTIALSLGYARKDKKGFTEAEFGILVKWAEKVRIEQGMLENVLSGSFICDVVHGEPSFFMSPRGISEVKAMGLKTRHARLRKTK